MDDGAGERDEGYDHNSYRSGFKDEVGEVVDGLGEALRENVQYSEFASEDEKLHSLSIIYQLKSCKVMRL